MAARKKAFLGVGLATLGLAAIVGGTVYVSKNSGDLLAAPRHALVQMINESNLSADDRLYLLQTNIEKVDPQTSIQVFDQYVLEKLPADQKLAYINGEVVDLGPENSTSLMDALVQGAGIPKTLTACRTNVFDVAGPVQQLDTLQSEIQSTPSGNYAPLVGTMAQRLGTDLYDGIVKLFKGGK